MDALACQEVQVSYDDGRVVYHLLTEGGWALDLQEEAVEGGHTAESGEGVADAD